MSSLFLVETVAVGAATPSTSSNTTVALATYDLGTLLLGDNVVGCDLAVTANCAAAFELHTDISTDNGATWTQVSSGGIAIGFALTGGPVSVPVQFCNQLAAGGHCLVALRGRTLDVSHALTLAVSAAHIRVSRAE